MPLEGGAENPQERKELYSKAEALIIGNSQGGGIEVESGINGIIETQYIEGALLKKMQQEEAKITPNLKVVVLFPQSRNGKNALGELRSAMDFVRGKAPNAKFIIASPTPLKDAEEREKQNDPEQRRRSAYIALLENEIRQNGLGNGVEFYDTGAAFNRMGAVAYAIDKKGVADNHHLRSYRGFAKDFMKQFGIGMPMDRARETAGSAITNLARLRSALPKYTRNFTPQETERFKKATGKERLDYETLSKMSLEEIDAAEQKDPGLFAATFVEKNTFRTQGNESVEWEKGLADAIKDEKVRGIRLYIKIENLDKGQSNEKLKGGAGLEHKTINDQEYVIVDSASRDENGDFYSKFGYMAIFDGDFWETTKVWTDEEYKAHQEAKLAKQKAARETRVQEFHIDVAGLTDEQIDEKITEKQKEKYAEMMENGGWSKLMGDAMEAVGLPKTALAQAIGWAIVQYESGFRPDVKYNGEVKSDASGLGQFLSSSRREMYRLLKSDGISVPESADGEFKEDPKWQLMCLAKLIQRNSARFQKDGIDVFSGKPRDVAFLYLAHHEGVRGVKMYVNWWKSNGNPDSIPEFPDIETANKFAVAKHQRNRPLVRPKIHEGTNEVLATAYKVANTAIEYSNNPEKLIAILNKKEKAFVDRMSA